MGTSGTRAENISVGFTSAASAMNGWMNSPGHRANILNDSVSQIGVGCFYANGAWYGVQLFRSGSGGSGSVLSGYANKAIAVKARPSVLALRAGIQYFFLRRCGGKADGRRSWEGRGRFEPQYCHRKPEIPYAVCQLPGLDLEVGRKLYDWNLFQCRRGYFIWAKVRKQPDPYFDLRNTFFCDAGCNRP